MIVVLSLNTAIDRILTVPRFRRDEVNDARTAQAFAGGKGLNVARVLRRLDVSVRVVGFLGGAATPFVREACSSVGIDARWVTISGETRTCIIVVDEATGAQTVVNEPGPAVTQEEVQRLEAEIFRATAPGDIVCISGSAPPGVPDGFYAGLIGRLRERDVRVLADVKGERLRQVLAAHPWAVTPNEEEARAAISAGTRIDLVRTLAHNADQVLLTLGSEGILYASGEDAVMLEPPPVRAVNAVGSGDAAVAGFLASSARGDDPLDAARLAVACGASNASRLEPDIGSGGDVERLTQGVRVSRPAG